VEKLLETSSLSFKSVGVTYRYLYKKDNAQTDTRQRFHIIVAFDCKVFDDDASNTVKQTRSRMECICSASNAKAPANRVKRREVLLSRLEIGQSSKKSQTALLQPHALYLSETAANCSVEVIAMTRSLLIKRLSMNAADL